MPLVSLRASLQESYGHVPTIDEMNRRSESHSFIHSYVKPTIKRKKKLTDLRTWDAWRSIHQPFELSWWKDALLKGHSCDDVEFAERWEPVRKFINRPSGERLDIGCGPRPPFPPCIVIEPLATAYKEITPEAWWKDVYSFSQPAERIIPELVGEFDLVICWNCLDHAIGWRDILSNMAAYGKPDARYAVATDFFERQSNARRNTRWLVIVFLLSVIAIVATTFIVTTISIGL